jgi:NagD protein
MKELNEIKCFLLDMDGTFYLGNKLIDGALEFIEKIKSQDKLFFFLTNNSSKSSTDYQQKLKRMGVFVSTEQIITSGQVTASFIRDKNKEARVYLVGTPSLHKEFINLNLKITTDKNQEIDYLVLGFDTTLNYQKLWDAHDLILKGRPYIATNPDYVCPLEDGKTMPDCGSIISLLKTSTGREPFIIGKPNTLMIDYVAKRTGIGKDEIAIIGDRLYTDIQTAINANITGILVLSGETKREDLTKAPQKPDFVFRSIRDIRASI